MIKILRGGPWWLLGALLICAPVLPGLLNAQQNVPPTPPAAPAGQAKADKDKDDPAIQAVSKTQNDRIFWTLPNFLTVENEANVPPLSSGQKFKLVARGTFDPVEYPFVGVVALIDQASNSQPSFGQGFRGYAKRYGTAFADNTSGNFMTGAVYPAMLRQDPRYFQLGRGGFLRRTGYALSRVFVTRTDSGGKQFNYSEILGNATAAAISNAYHPPPRTLGNNISIWWTEVGWDAASFELKEFWPDIKHRLHKP